MAQSLGPDPTPGNYRQFLALQLRKRAMRQFGHVGAPKKFHEKLVEAGMPVELNTVYKWFAGSRFPDVEHLRTVAKVLHTTIDKLVPECPEGLNDKIGRSTRTKSAE